MKFALSLLLSVAAQAALAHPSFFPHDHPHGPSLLADLDGLLLLGALAGFAIVVAGQFGKR